MPRSDERLLAAMKLMKPHVPSALYDGFKHEFADFLRAVVPAIDNASAMLRETTDPSKPNSTPIPPRRLSGGSKISHVVMTATTLVGLWL
jgi:hypothetical protein